MFVHYFVNYFVRLWTNYYTLLTISPISFIFSWLYTYHFSCFGMFVHYFVRLRNNHYTLFTISPISVIFDSARNSTRNLLYRPFWHFVKIPIVWRERRNARWEKWWARWFTKYHLYTSHLSCFANIFSHSRQFDDKCIAGFWFCKKLAIHPLWHFMKIVIAWWERRNVRWEKWLSRRFTKCHQYTSRFSRFANMFSRSRQFDDKCIAGFRQNTE